MPEAPRRKSKRSWPYLRVLRASPSCICVRILACLLGALRVRHEDAEINHATEKHSCFARSAIDVLLRRRRVLVVNRLADGRRRR